MRGTRCIARTGLLAVVSACVGTASAQTTCAEPLSVERLETLVGEAERAIDELNDQHFLSLMGTVLPPKLPCLDAPVPPPLAARYHWLVAMYNVGPDEESAFDAVLATHRLGEHDDRRLLEGQPEDHALRRLYANVPPDREHHTLRAPTAGAIYFDGIDTLDRPVDQFTIVQYLDADGAVTTTKYLLRDQVLDAYEGARVRDLRPAKELYVGSGGRGFDPSRPAFKRTLVGAGAVGVAAGVFYGLAIASKARFQDASEPATLDELQALQRRTNALGVTADGLAITAGVGVGAAFLVASF